MKKKKKVENEAAFDAAFDKAMDIALAAEPKDVKIHLTVRLDMDIYRELKARAEKGAGDGKYQRLMNQLLRQSLFAEAGETAERTDTEFNRLVAEAASAVMERLKSAIIQPVKHGQYGYMTTPRSRNSKPKREKAG